MLEKIRLPAKPSARGRTWVIDASSCQTCQGVFTMFNRKHHCRRCGGIFCGNCTSQRAILRGQGDAPVRICDPCKKLEEAARFQLRNRGKKGAKAASIAEDDSLLKEVLSDEALARHSNRDESGDDEVEDHQSDRDLVRSARSSKSGSAYISPSKDGTDEQHEEIHFTPEELRSQAIEQKNLYTNLKKEGKHAEALQAYKRSKELGREADALELSLKKMQRKPTVGSSEELKGSSESVKERGQERKGKDLFQDSKRVRLSSKDSGDDDLLETLKDLGWDEADLVETNARKGSSSDLALLAEISDILPKEASEKKPTKQNPTQLEILAYKRKALALKREGKPSEAKEELKKAKLLEKKLEEMALFGDEDEDDDAEDDELAKLMKSLEKEAKLDLGKGSTGKAPVDFSLPSFLDEDDDDAHVDVTDDDIHDPSIVAALREMGWEEEAAAMEQSRAPPASGPEALHIAATVATEASLQSEILNHKRQALALKREGKIPEAKIQLQEAKTTEQKLEALRRQPPVPTVRVPQSKRGSVKDATQITLEDILEDKDDPVVVDEEDEKDPEILSALKAMGYEEDETAPSLQTDVKPSPQEKKNLQDEILAVKRSALAFKKSGRIAEAKEELRHAKVLEQKLEKLTAELEAAGPPKPMTVGTKWEKTQIPALTLPQTGFVSEDEEEEVEVSAEDFKDPELVAALKSVGWQEEDTFVKDKEPEKVEEPDSPPPPVQFIKPVKYTAKTRQRKLQLEKDLLSHKRKALTLKREGKSEEARAELLLAKALEKEMEELENAASGYDQAADEGLLQKSRHDTANLPAPIAYEYEVDTEVTDADMHDPEILDALKAVGWKTEPESTVVNKQCKSSSSALPALAGLKNTVSLKTVLDSGRMADPTPKEIARFDTTKVGSKKYENPPYTKEASTDKVSDPVWRSSSKTNEEYNEPVRSNRDVYELRRGTFSETDCTLSVNPEAPFFDHPALVSSAAHNSSQQGSLDLDFLTGDIWTAPTKDDMVESDSDEDEDIFDADMVAALQSIGWTPPILKTGKRPQSKSVVAEQAANSRMPMKDGSSAPAKDDRVKTSRGSLPIAEAKFGRVETGSPSVFSANDSRKEIAASGAVSPPPTAGTSDLHEEIKTRKRKAVAFKREGKLAEAREELRQAKLLEKQLEIGTSAAVPDEDLKSAGASIGDDQPQRRDEIPPPVIPTAALTHKQHVQQQVRQGKDRMKLQRESLAHKRKALGLRREGKLEEAEAEFELAKALEKQMEELDPSKPARDDGDVGLVEDLLDPQLMAALKGIGWNEADLSRGSVGKTASSTASVSSITEQEVTRNRPASSTSTIALDGLTNTSNQAPSRRVPDSACSSNASEERSTNVRQPPLRKAPVSATSSNALDERSASMSTLPPARRAPSVTATANAGPSASKVQEERKPAGSVGVGTSSTLKAQEERKKLEDRIKLEKVRAVELKRAGRTREALDALKGAKQLKKQLESIP